LSESKENVQLEAKTDFDLTGGFVSSEEIRLVETYLGDLLGIMMREKACEEE
jgi:hypothetical protein